MLHDIIGQEKATKQLRSNLHCDSHTSYSDDPGHDPLSHINQISFDNHVNVTYGYIIVLSNSIDLHLLQL